jgi:hypothetical protein
LIENLRPDNRLAQAPYLSGAVQPDRPLGDRRAQSRGHSAGGDDCL